MSAARRKGARPSRARTPLDRALAQIGKLTDADRARLKEALGFKDPTYNGWSNYETWCVSLWIDNEEGSYNEARRMAREAAEEAKADAEEIAAHGSRSIGVIKVEWPRKADDLLARRLKEWIEEAQPDLGASMFSDLLGAALSEVDWHEIAHSMQGD